MPSVPDPTAHYEYRGQQGEHRGKMFRYAQSMTIQDVVPVHQFECGDGSTITLKTDRWQDVMKDRGKVANSPPLEPLPEPPKATD